MKDYNIIPLIVLLPTFCTISFFIGIQVGSNLTWNTAINFATEHCVDDPVECKKLLKQIKQLK
jgi:hypothetical protein